MAIKEPTSDEVTVYEQRRVYRLPTGELVPIAEDLPPATYRRIRQDLRTAEHADTVRAGFAGGICLTIVLTIMMAVGFIGVLAVMAMNLTR